MKNIIIVLGLSLLTLISCDFSKSVNVNLVTGLSTKGDGLSCEDVYLSDGENEINRSSFVYGELFTVYFENIEGFSKSDNNVFPGMSLSVKGEDGEVVLEYDDLYADYTDGVDLSPLVLSAVITAAKPMASNSNYTLLINIWDKKGEGTLEAKLDFDIVLNEHIKIEANGVSYDEIYLFSQERGVTITGNSAFFNENIYLMFEGLEGFSAEGGNVFAGLSITAKDANGEVILSEEDLLGDSGMEISEFSSQLAPNISFSDPEIKSPVAFEIVIWDKKSENRIQTKVELNLESE